MADLKKFLDQQGVSTLWSKIAEKVAAETAAREQAMAAEASRVDLAIADVASDVADLTTYVGTIPADYTESNIVAFIQKRASEVLAAAQGGSSETATSVKSALDAYIALNDPKVAQNTTDIAAIVADYLKAADKQELADAIAAEASRADTAEKANAAAIKAIVDDYLKAADKAELQANIDEVAEDVADIVKDYLKAADKTELEGKINAKADQTALDAEIERATQAEAGLQTQINTIMNNPDAEGAINSINEFTKYVEEHGTIADGFRVDIDQNKSDIAAEAKRAGEAETALAGRLDVLEAIDHDAYVAADTALKNELNAEIAKKADATALTAAVETLEAADAGIIERVAAVEAQLGDGEGSVADLIADAKAEVLEELATAIEDAKTDASNKDVVVLAEAQKSINAVQATIDTHTGNADIHVTTADKTKWNAALQAADIKTGTENGTIAVKGTDVAVKGLGSAAYVATTAFDAAGSAAAAESRAKAYADGLAVNYDAAGAAATAEANAKAYVDSEINTHVIALTIAEIEAAIASV